MSWETTSFFLTRNMAQKIATFLSENSDFLLNATAVVGSIWFLGFFLRNLCSLCNNFLAFVLPKLGIYKVNVTKYGSWASE